MSERFSRYGFIFNLHCLLLKKNDFQSIGLDQEHQYHLCYQHHQYQVIEIHVAGSISPPESETLEMRAQQSVLYQTLSHRLTENPPREFTGPFLDLLSNAMSCPTDCGFLLLQVLLSSTSAQQDHTYSACTSVFTLLLKNYTRGALRVMEFTNGFPCL